MGTFYTVLGMVFFAMICASVATFLWLVCAGFCVSVAAHRRVVRDRRRWRHWEAEMAAYKRARDVTSRGVK